jgi:hypothetical protein
MTTAADVKKYNSVGADDNINTAITIYYHHHGKINIEQEIDIA